MAEAVIHYKGCYKIPSALESESGPKKRTNAEGIINQHKLLYLLLDSVSNTCIRSRCDRHNLVDIAKS